MEAINSECVKRPGAWILFYIPGSTNQVNINGLLFFLYFVIVVVVFKSFNKIKRKTETPI